MILSNVICIGYTIAGSAVVAFLVVKAVSQIGKTTKSEARNKTESSKAKGIVSERRLVGIVDTVVAQAFFVLTLFMLASAVDSWLVRDVNGYWDCTLSPDGNPYRYVGYGVWLRSEQGASGEMVVGDVHRIHVNGEYDSLPGTHVDWKGNVEGWIEEILFFYPVSVKLLFDYENVSVLMHMKMVRRDDILRGRYVSLNSIVFGDVDCERFYDFPNPDFYRTYE